jgi:NADH-quinone oxidoreductase subunit J
MTALLILSPLIMLAALGAVWKARPVHAGLLLALTLSLAGMLYIALGAEFLGLVQFMVYVGAVAVLIVFALLITRPRDEIEEIARRPKSVGPGLLCTLPLLATLLYTVDRTLPEAPPGTAELPVKRIGELLFTTHAPAVLAVAILLTAVMLGAALFAREPSKKP